MKAISAVMVTSFTLLSGDFCRQSDLMYSEAAEQGLVVAIGKMSAQRFAHTSTLLPDGRVLITGGQNGGALTSAELFDPTSNTFAAARTMKVARSGHTATLLPNGTVLIAGGYNGSYLSTAEVYDPATGKFTPTSQMTVARSGHEAILLKNGKVLLVGGVGTGWTFLSSAEIYDPRTSTFAPTGSMTTARESHTATLLTNGKVLITGGHKGRRATITIYASAELYDPSSGTFSLAGNMSVRRHKHDAALLSDGTVLIVGGANERDRNGTYTSAEIYSPNTGEFKLVGNMKVRRYKHRGTTILLPTTQVLIAGGSTLAELYDPALNTFIKVNGSMGSDRLFSAATLLRNGRVLITGGYDENMVTSSTAWLYQ
jgi:N-acetylneuraminic acid mutarotase